MRPANLSLRQLRAFVALAEQRNFTRAAEYCSLSQPAFSTLIQTFEEAAGARLFDRTTRTVELTGEGRVLEPWVRRLLGDFESAFSALEDHVSLRKGRMALAVAPSLAASWLPPIIAEYHRANPQVVIRLYDRLSDQCIELLRQGKADFALTGYRAPDADLAVELLLDDRLRVVCSHRFANATRLRLSDLAGETLFHLVGSSNTRQQLDVALEDVPVAVNIEVVHLTTLIGLVSTGMGISVLPTFSLARFQSPDLVSIELVEPELHRTFYIVHLQNRSLSPSALDMLERIRRHRPELEQVTARIAAPRDEDRLDGDR